MKAIGINNYNFKFYHPLAWPKLATLHKAEEYNAGGVSFLGSMCLTTPINEKVCIMNLFLGDRGTYLHDSMNVMVIFRSGLASQDPSMPTMAALHIREVVQIRIN